MREKDFEGFFNNPFFVAINPKGENLNNEEKEKVNQILNRCYDIDYQKIGNDDRLFSSICHMFIKKDKYEMRFYNIIREKIEKIMINYMIEEELLHYFMPLENVEKIITLVERNTYNAKIIKLSLYKFDSFISNYDHSYYFYLLFNLRLKEEMNTFYDDLIVKEMSDFRKLIDSITSGVKRECYLNFGKKTVENSEELEEYIQNKHGYSLEKNRHRDDLYIGYNNMYVLDLYLFNDTNLWWCHNNYMHERTIKDFLNLVVKFNGIKHAKKIIDYTFEQICKNQFGKYIYDRKLNLVLLLDLDERLLDYAVNRLYRKIKLTVDHEEDKKGLLYPKYSGFDNQIREGKIVFERFVKNSYPNNYDQVFNILYNIDTVIEEKVDGNMEFTIKDVLDTEILGYDLNSDLRKFMYEYYSDFGKSESVIKRLYFRVYLINKYYANNDDLIYEYLYDILNKIEKRFGIASRFITASSVRDNNFKKLSKILSVYNFNIKEENKNLYITTLLDRKCASLKESNMFPQLEQLGDAIYELAVAEIFFYNKDEKYNQENKEKYTKADFQIEIAKKLGIDKLYITANTIFKSKYLKYEKVDQGLFCADGNYLADSLEMIIGVISMEFGIRKAVDFAIKIILETDCNLKKPLKYRFENISIFDDNIDKYYCQKIFMSRGVDEYYSEYYFLYLTLEKIIKIYLIGNDTKEKREKIYETCHIKNNNNDWEDYVFIYCLKGIEVLIDELLK